LAQVVPLVYQMATVQMAVNQLLLVQPLLVETVELEAQLQALVAVQLLV
jgi:hypothetical protein